MFLLMSVSVCLSMSLVYFKDLKRRRLIALIVLLTVYGSGYVTIEQLQNIQASGNLH